MSSLPLSVPVPSWLKPSTYRTYKTKKEEKKARVELEHQRLREEYCLLGDTDLVHPNPAHLASQPVSTDQEPTTWIELSELPPISDWGILVPQPKRLSASEQVDQADTYVRVSEDVFLAVYFPPPTSHSQIERLHIVAPVDSSVLGTFDRLEINRNLYSSFVTFQDFTLRSGHRVVSGILTVPLPEPWSKSSKSKSKCSCPPVRWDEEPLTLVLHIDPDTKGKGLLTETTSPSSLSTVKRLERKVRIPGYLNSAKGLWGQRMHSATVDLTLEDAEWDKQTNSRLWTTRSVTMTFDYRRRLLGVVPSGVEDVHMTCKTLHSAYGDTCGDLDADFTAHVEGFAPASLPGEGTEATEA